MEEYTNRSKQGTSNDNQGKLDVDKYPIGYQPYANTFGNPDNYYDPCGIN